MSRPRAATTDSQHRVESGQDLVEYALIFPVLFMLIFGIVEFGIIIFSYNTIANAAREGARVGIIPTNSNADVENAVTAMTIGLNSDAVTVEVTRSEPCEGTVKVVVEYDVSLITSQLLGTGPTVSLNTEAEMQCEG